MKKSVLLLLISISISAIVTAQVVNIPESTKKNFAEKYAQAKNVAWHNNVTNYTATFKDSGKSSTAHYHLDGTWNYTEKFIDKSDLPGAVKEAYEKSRIAASDYKSSAYIENSHSEKAYRIEAKKGVEKIFLFFDKDGKEIKSLAGL